MGSFFVSILAKDVVDVLLTSSTAGQSLRLRIHQRKKSNLDELSLCGDAIDDSKCRAKKEVKEILSI
jgi:hypothetical protein